MTASRALAAVVALVERLVSFVAPGVRFGRRDVATLLVYAAARRVSLTRACDDLAGAMSDSRLRQLWSRFQVTVVQAKLNRLLAVHAAACLAGRRLRLAVDLTLIPYHGKPHRNQREVYRGPAKSGTSHFHAYATAYVIQEGRRFTVALKYVRKGEDLTRVLRFLLGRVEAAGLTVGALYVDRGFCNVRCIRFFQSLPHEVLMPLVARGRQGAALLQGRAGRRTTYTMSSPRDGDVTFDVVVAVVYAKGRRGQHKANKYAYVALRCDASPRTVFDRYRTRFGIEASYRLMHRSRSRTCTRNPAVRLVLIGVALLIENEWVWIKYSRLSVMRRGASGRVVHHELLRFDRFLAWIVHTVNVTLGLVTEVAVPTPPPTAKRRRRRPSRGGGNY